MPTSGEEERFRDMDHTFVRACGSHGLHMVDYLFRRFRGRVHFRSGQVIMIINKVRQFSFGPRLATISFPKERSIVL